MFNYNNSINHTAQTQTPALEQIPQYPYAGYYPAPAPVQIPVSAYMENAAAQMRQAVPTTVYAKTVVGCGAIGAAAGAIIGAPVYGVTRAVTDIVCDIADMISYASDRHAAKKAARQGYMPATAPTPQPMLPPRFMRAAADTTATLKVINDDPFLWLMQLSREEFFEAWDTSNASERNEIISWIQAQLVAVMYASDEVQQLVNLAAAKILLEINQHQKQAQQAAANQAQQQAQQVHNTAVQNLQQQHDVAVQAAQQNP